MNVLQGGPVRRFIRKKREERRLRGSPQERLVPRAVLTKKVKYGDVDGVRVTYVASGEISLEDWRRLVREKKDEEFIRKVVDELREMGFIIG